MYIIVINLRNNKYINMQKASPEKKEYYKIKSGGQLNSVYKNIITNFDQQVFRFKQNKSKQLSPFSDEQILFKANQTLPKLGVSPNQKKLQNKYYSNKLIINDSVVVLEKKQGYRDYGKSQKLPIKQCSEETFKKIDIPNVMTTRDRNILSERHKRIIQLYKKVEDNRKSNASPIKISFIRQMKRSSFSQNDTQQIIKDNLSESSSNSKLRMRPSDKKMLSILKEAKQKRKKLGLPSMSPNRSKKLHLKDEDPANVLKYEKCEISSRKKSAESGKKDISVEQKAQTVSKKTKNKSLIKFNRSKQILGINLKKRGFNWRNLQLNLNKINKEEFYDLLRGYLGFFSIQPIHSGFYRAYIGPGNNNSIVKKTLKQRNHWTIVESIDDDPHFVWTQLKNTKFSDKLQNKVNQTAEKQEIMPKQNLQTLENDEQLREFLELKTNDFILGCQKLLEREVYLRLMFEIKQKFIAKAYLTNFRKLRYQALEKLPNVKYKYSAEQPIKANQIRLHNHVDQAGAIGDKKGLFHYLRKYSVLFQQDINQIVPQTVHIDSENFNEDSIFQQIAQGPWIVKPGQATNRGQGITVHITKQSLLTELSKKKKHAHNPQVKYTTIIQKYIFPLLYNNRKFDIRMWVLWNSNARQAWWYQEGYLRTSSKQFTLKSTNKYIHLTNDAIQSQSQDFGKYEPANKLSFSQFNKYLQNQFGYKMFNDKILKEMKQLAYKVFRVGNMLLDPHNKQSNFQLYGLDFLVDNQFKPWLIQCNTNPSLQINCSLLTRLIPNMLDNLMNITVDTLFPVPNKRKPKQPQQWNHETFKFELLYDGSQDIEIRQRLLTQPNINISYQQEFEQQNEI